MLSGMIATGIIQIWCIFDVVKIAKIKNLANQNNKVTIKLNPDLNLISKDYNNNSAVYGLRLSFVFWKYILNNRQYLRIKHVNTTRGIKHWGLGGYSSILPSIKFGVTIRFIHYIYNQH